MVAVIKDSVLHAEILKPGQPAWMVLDGKIEADGKANLVAQGLTGDPKATLNKSKPGSPYGFTVSAQFDGRSGTGKRNELRPCDLKFTKR